MAEYPERPQLTYWRAIPSIAYLLDKEEGHWSVITERRGREVPIATHLTQADATLICSKELSPMTTPQRSIVPLEEALVAGKKKRRSKKCGVCGGLGWGIEFGKGNTAKEFDCPICNGTGKQREGTEG